MNIEFLTQLLGLKVQDTVNTIIGTVQDVIAATPASESGNTLPQVVALLLRHGKEEQFLRWTSFTFENERLVLKDSTGSTYTPQPEDLYLRRDVLDHQIVDTLDFRVVRVSDVRLAPASEGKLVVLGVDPGQVAVLRRLLPGNWGEKMAHALHLPDSGGFIAWRDVEPTAHNEQGVLRLRTTRDKLSELHPADIADILEQMTPSDRSVVLQNLDVEKAADVVTEANEELQVEIMQHLPTETAADILEEMEPDDAADVVGDLPGSRRKELLDEMQDAEAQDVRELLHYDDDTAGGLMTTEFVALPTGLTAEGAIGRLREMAPNAETIYYLYVTEPEENDPQNERLVGVISLRDLIVAAPNTPLWNIMVENVIRVGLDASLEEVARTLEHYDLLAVPVVDAQDRIQGIVTVDDTLEELLPASWRRKKFRSRRNTHHRKTASEERN